MAKKKVQPKDDMMDFFTALTEYAQEKGIDRDVFVSKIKSAIEKSLKTNMHLEDKDSEVVFVNIDFDRHIFNVSVLKEVIEVVDTLYEPEIEIVLEDARKIEIILYLDTDLLVRDLHWKSEHIMHRILYIFVF